MGFFKPGVTPLLAPSFISYLNLRLLEAHLPLRPTLDTPLGSQCSCRSTTYRYALPIVSLDAHNDPGRRVLDHLKVVQQAVVSYNTAFP